MIETSSIAQMVVLGKRVRLLNVDVFVRNHMHKPILDVRIEILHTAERFQPNQDSISCWSACAATGLPRSTGDSYRRKPGARI